MPTPDEVHIDAALTGVSVAYANNEYIAEKVAPVVTVTKQSDKYFIYDAEREWLRPSNDLRAPGTPADEVNYAMSNDAYFCRDHALASAVSDEERQNADFALTPEIDRTEFLTEKILLNQELELSRALEAAELPGEQLTDNRKWSLDTGTPIGDLHAAARSVSAGIQRRPNILLVSQAAFEALANHSSVVERFQYNGAASITADMIARMVGVDEVVVGRAYYNSAKPGQTPSVVPIWDTTAYLLYINRRPGLRSMGALSTFTWTGNPTGVRGRGFVVERWREPWRKSDMVRVSKYYDTKIVASRGIYRLQNVI